MLAVNAVLLEICYQGKSEAVGIIKCYLRQQCIGFMVFVLVRCACLLRVLETLRCRLRRDYMWAVVKKPMYPKQQQCHSVRLIHLDTLIREYCWIYTRSIPPKEFGVPSHGRSHWIYLVHLYLIKFVQRRVVSSNPYHEGVSSGGEKWDGWD